MFGGGKWDIPKGTKVLKVVEMLGLPEEESKSLLLLVNGHHVDSERVLGDGDCLHVFPLISGG
ncbi:MAG: MoaD/ThiS family protein [Deltaproteobacteria bacterium]|nr:MoaD/ThiS family protein [Deltaproteobacteria bacterium]